MPSPARARLVLVPNAAPAPSDAALVESLRAGERGAKEAFYRRHVGYVGGMCARLLRSRELAEDVVQDTFLLAFERIDSLRDPNAGRGWLSAIAVSLVRRHLRRQKFLGFFGFGAAADAALDLLASEEASAEVRAQLAAIDLALREIAPNHRIAWMLRHVEGCSLEEVATACECSLATAKRWLAAADECVASHVQGGEP